MSGLYFCLLKGISLTSISILLNRYHAVFIVVTLWLVLKLGSMCFPTLLFFLAKLFLAIRCPLHFHVNCRISLSNSSKRSAEVLIWIALNVLINLGSIAMLTILSVLIHEYGMSFYLCRSSLISFKNVLYFKSKHFILLLLNLCLRILLFLMLL